MHEAATYYPGVFCKTQIAGPHPRVFDSVALTWDHRICISKKLQVAAAAAAAGPGIVLDPWASTSLGGRVPCD